MKGWRTENVYGYELCISIGRTKAFCSLRVIIGEALLLCRMHFDSAIVVSSDLRIVAGWESTIDTGSKHHLRTLQECA